MGRARTPKPGRLAEKLLEIRTRLGLSQNGMARLMGLEDQLTQAEISAFERDIRVPPLPVLLSYARAAGVYMDALVDDQLDLPETIPCRLKHEGVSRVRNRSPRK
jgi:transcriptional regulator with XRE-family HTH domain